MKKWLSVVPLILSISCERFPANPEREAEPVPTVQIASMDIQYIPILKTVDGLTAKKMNVLTVRFRTKDIRAKALELLGSTLLEGPPCGLEYGLCFRTDRLDAETTQPGMPWNVIPAVQSDTSYEIMRCKIPMNNYAPFAGDQGRVVQIRIQEAWAVDDTGIKTRVEIVPSAEGQPIQQE